MTKKTEFIQNLDGILCCIFIPILISHAYFFCVCVLFPCFWKGNQPSQVHNLYMMNEPEASIKEICWFVCVCLCALPPANVKSSCIHFLLISPFSSQLNVLHCPPYVWQMTPSLTSSYTHTVPEADETSQFSLKGKYNLIAISWLSNQLIR